MDGSLGGMERVGQSFMLLFFIGVPTSFLFSFLERKLSADFQARVGANRAGPAGIFQSFADLLKLFQKKESVQKGLGQSFWFVAHCLTLYSALMVLPFGSDFLLYDSGLNIFLPLLIALVLALSTLFLGLSLEELPGRAGGLRLAAQAASGFFPALLALLCVGISGGGFRWSVLVEAQGFFPTQWALFQNPFQPAIFFVFLVSGLVLFSLAPLNCSFGGRDIQGGLESYLIGKWGVLFRLGRFYCLFYWSLMTAIFFLGAWKLPEFLVTNLKHKQAFFLLQGFEFITVIAKAVGLMLLWVWVSRASPRVRVDQVTDFSWKVLSPLALISLMGVTFWIWSAR